MASGKSRRGKIARGEGLRALGRGIREIRGIRGGGVAERLEGRVLLSKTVYVDVNSSGPVRDGTSWGSAFTDLQLGLGAAASGDEIHVADGVYKPTSGPSRSCLEFLS